MKSVIIIILVILVVAILGWFLWLFFDKEQTTNIEKEGFFENFFPFGDSGSSDENTPKEENNNLPILPAEIIRQISSSPVSGFTASSTTEGESAVYMERESGHIYQAPLQLITKKRLSNTTFPGVQEILWHNLQPHFLARYLSEDERSVFSFSAKIFPGEKDEEGFIEGLFIQDNASNVTRNQKNKIFTLKEEGEGISGFTSNFDGTGIKKVFTHALTEWTSQWVKDDYVFLTTKPSGYAFGSLYELNLKNGSLSEILSRITGLETLSNGNGSRILYSSGGGSFNLFAYDPKTKETADLDLNTSAKKCVWKKDGIKVVCAVPKSPESTIYPDDWYMGLASFADEIWEIDTKTGNTEILMSSENFRGTSLDMMDPQLSSDENYFLFVNKKDLSLWSVKITK